MTSEVISQPHISDFLLRHRDMWGAKLVFLLQSKPDESFHVIRLAHLIDPPECPFRKTMIFTRSFESYCAIPMTDYQTLRDIDKRLIKLIAIKAELVVNHLDFSLIDTEIQSLVDYRKETTSPLGRIKNFSLETRTEQKRIHQAFTRLLEKALVECPDAYYLFKKHVKTGSYYQWISFPDEVAKPVTKEKKKKKSTKHRKKPMRC